MRKVLILLVAASGLVAVGLIGLTALSPDDLLKDEGTSSSSRRRTYKGGSKAGSSWNMRVVGHNNLDVRGFNGDVWKYGDYAYVGHWASPIGRQATTGSARKSPTTAWL